MLVHRFSNKAAFLASKPRLSDSLACHVAKWSELGLSDLPSSQSSFRIKAYFLASTPCVLDLLAYSAASRVRLDSATIYNPLLTSLLMCEYIAYCVKNSLKVTAGKMISP